MSFPNSNEGYDDFIDVSDDVISNSFGRINQKLEADEFNVGKITFGNLKFVFRNEDSKYSEAVNPTSIFPFKRDKTIVKIEWSRNTHPPRCGQSPAGHTFLSREKVVFKGLLEDNSTNFDVDSQAITFSVLSMDSIIKNVDTPFSDLSVSDNAETLLFTILNQTKITQFFTVDAGNINVSNNFVPDDISSLENTTCLESIQEILKIANSIMFVRDDTLYIRSRTEDVSSSFTFFGPSSDSGIENILNISGYSEGLNRTFNFWTFDGTTQSVEFADSIEKYGRRKKEISSDLITDSGKITTVLNSYLTEFGFPAKEFDLTVPMTTPIVQIGFLNKINVDYPADVLPLLDEVVARYGQAVYDEARYAKTVNSLFIAIETDWKILNISINPRSQNMVFKVREVL